MTYDWTMNKAGISDMITSQLQRSLRVFYLRKLALQELLSILVY